jgi:predicted transposase/invertase (TIGR01784 family)
LTFLSKIKTGAQQIPPELLEEEITKDAVKWLEINSYTKAELNTYDKYLDIIRTTRTYYGDALETGEKKGIEKGIEMEKAETAINCLRIGLSSEQIQAITGLNKEQIEEIIKYNLK